MKNKIKLFGIIALVAVIGFSFTACSGSGGGGKRLNSATELKEYLDKQPANSPDKPIKVAMKVNDMMIKDIAEVIKNAGKYVSLNLSGSPLTEVPNNAFKNCKTLANITIPNGFTSIKDSAFASTSLTSVTIPDSVTSIEKGAFRDCANLTSVTFQSTIDKDNFGKEDRSLWYIGYISYDSPFDGDLHAEYLEGGIGTYTRSSGSNAWTKNASTSQNNSKQSDGGSSNDLTGTTWVYSEDAFILTFNSSSDVTMTGDNNRYTGTYTVSGNTITITIGNGSYNGSFIGKISGNKLTLEGEFEGGVFTKQ